MEKLDNFYNDFHKYIEKRAGVLGTWKLPMQTIIKDMHLYRCRNYQNKEYLKLVINENTTLTMDFEIYDFKLKKTEYGIELQINEETQLIF